MNGHTAVYGLLSNSASLAALVAQRIFPDVMPDSPAYPAVTYQKLGGGSARGALSDPPLMWALFQVSSWAKSRADAAGVTRQVRGALERKRKLTVAGVAVDDCFYQDDVDLYDNDTRTYFNHCTFKIFYRDTP
ncbi:hypothetical protein AAKU55_003145 [Oxalobacteraceae bacterium GrIS 1.11]